MYLEIILLSFQVSIIATLMNIIPAVGVGWLLVKRKTPINFLLDLIVSLPLALPPVIIGFFLLTSLSNSSPLGQLSQIIFGKDIVFTWFAAAIASAVVSFPLMVRSIMVGIADVDIRLEKSARILGAGAWRVFFTITVPLAYKGMLAGLLIGFVRAFSEFGATVVVAGSISGSTETLPVAIYGRILTGKDSEVLELIGISILFAVVTLLIHNWLMNKYSYKDDRN